MKRIAIVATIIVALLTVLVGLYSLVSRPTTMTSEVNERSDGLYYVVLSNSIRAEVTSNNLPDIADEDRLAVLSDFLADNTFLVSSERLYLVDGWGMVLNRSNTEEQQSKCGDNCYQFTFSGEDNGDVGGMKDTIEGKIDLSDHTITLEWINYVNNPGEIATSVVRATAQVAPMSTES